MIQTTAATVPCQAGVANINVSPPFSVIKDKVPTQFCLRITGVLGVRNTNANQDAHPNSENCEEVMHHIASGCLYVGIFLEVKLILRALMLRNTFVRVDMESIAKLEPLASKLTIRAQTMGFAEISQIPLSL